MTHDDTIDATLLDLMLRAGSRWVLWLLLGLSLIAVTVIAERLWFFIQERRPRQLLEAALAALRKDGPTAARDRLAGVRSLEARVARTCLDHAGAGSAAVEEHLTASLSNERLAYEKRLAFLGTLGANAPFVGLFGTVLGIVRSFHDLSSTTVQNTQAVMAGIAESLVATGVGLLVALPAVATYNAFTRHVETSAEAATAIGHEILAHIKAEPT